MGENDNSNTKPKAKSKKKLKILLTILSYLGSAVLGAFAQFPVEKFIFHKEKVKLWSVTGCLKLKDKDGFDKDDTVLSIKPPEQELYTDGQFVIHKVPIKTDANGKPSLLIRRDSYKIIQIVLEEKPPEYYKKFGLQDYSIKFQNKDKNIEIRNPIYLEREDLLR